uniref:hypothetical protein n=1 Tax=Brachyspira catarrhinii TaxID=2528966 RepID=UPI003F4B85C4
MIKKILLIFIIVLSISCSKNNNSATNPNSPSNSDLNQWKGTYKSISDEQGNILMTLNINDNNSLDIVANNESMHVDPYIIQENSENIYTIYEKENNEEGIILIKILWEGRFVEIDLWNSVNGQLTSLGRVTLCKEEFYNVNSGISDYKGIVYTKFDDASSKPLTVTYEIDAQGAIIIKDSSDASQTTINPGFIVKVEYEQGLRYMNFIDPNSYITFDKYSYRDNAANLISYDALLQNNAFGTPIPYVDLNSKTQQPAQ